MSSFSELVFLFIGYAMLGVWTGQLYSRLRWDDPTFDLPTIIAILVLASLWVLMLVGSFT